MGMFSMYTGLIYNDCFSKSVNIFSSHWKQNFNYTYVSTNAELLLDPKYTDTYIGTPYPIGIDPVWQVRLYWNFVNHADWASFIFFESDAEFSFSTYLNFE